MSEKPRYVNVTDAPGFIKDNTTGTLLNTDNSALRAYKNKKKAVAETEARLQRIESDMAEIKDMFSQILGKIK